MKQITRQELRTLEKELEQLEQQASDLASLDCPDEVTLNWIENRTNQIKTLLNSEERKARFSEKGLRLL